MNKRNYLEQYFKLLNYNELPNFILKYLNSPSLIRLKKIGYFCGMDYASKNIYNFNEYISRFDHSITTALLTWNLTKDKNATIAALFHDISTPCFSHVIDYMNKDYVIQESTEKYSEEVITKDKYLLDCLNYDNISLEDIINFKKHTIVDLERPMLCADRLDGIILTSLFWTKAMNMNEVNSAIKSISVYENENQNLEIGFNDNEVANMIIEKNNIIDIYCHSKEDNYMMELLANITKKCIEKEYFNYEELNIYEEEKIISKIITSNNKQILELWNLFKNIKKEDIPEISMPPIKKRVIKPLVNGKRI